MTLTILFHATLTAGNYTASRKWQHREQQTVLVGDVENVGIYAEASSTTPTDA
jgi:hypothetical protein